MSVSSPDERILGYLGRGLSLELSAVQTYSTQARLAASWGLDDAAQRFRDESREEMEHAERIIARMLALGVAPSASQLRPALVGTDLLALLQADYQFENELIGLYFAAANHAALVGRGDHRVFFQTLLEEERAHARELSAWIAQLGQAIDPAMASDNLALGSKEIGAPVATDDVAMASGMADRQHRIQAMAEQAQMRRARYRRHQ